MSQTLAPPLATRVVNSSTGRAVGAIVLGGFVLRLIGVWWGLPASLHADEWAIVESAVSLAAQGSYEPTIFLRPDHLEIKISVLLYTLYSVLPGVGALDAEYLLDPTPFFLMSRAVTVVFSTVAIALAGAIGARFSGSTAVIAAAIFAVYPPFVEHARYATPDMPLLALSLLVVLALMHYTTNPRAVPLIIASAALGASITVKYPGALGGVAIAVTVVAVAIIRKDLKRIFRDGFLAIAVAIATVFAISPVLLVNIRGVIAAIRAESRTEHVGADGLGFVGNAAFYAGDFASWAGVALCVAAAAGLWVVATRRLLQALPLAIGAVYWLALSVLALHWDRWGIPMAITPLLLAAVAFGHALDRPADSRPRWWRPAVIGALALGLAHMIVASVALTAGSVVPDSRVSSTSQLLSAGVTPSNTAYEGYSPFLTDGPARIFEQVREIDGRPYAVDPSIEFLMTSSCDNSRFMNDDRYVVEQEFYEWIDQELPLVFDLSAPSPLAVSPVEPVGILQSFGHIGELAALGRSGCTVLVYSITAAP